MHFERQFDYARRSRRGLWGCLRRRELAAVAALSPPLAGLRIWEACAGAGFYTHWMVNQGARQVVAVDRAQTMLDQMPAGPIETVCMEVSHYQPRGFDLAVCLGGLEFLSDVEAFFAQAAAAAPQMLLLVPRVNLGSQLYRLYHAWHGLVVHLRHLEDLDRAAGLSGWRRLCQRSAGPYSQALFYRLS